jgi:hypothetical protein
MNPENTVGVADGTVQGQTPKKTPYSSQVFVFMLHNQHIV